MLVLQLFYASHLNIVDAVGAPCIVTTVMVSLLPRVVAPGRRYVPSCAIVNRCTGCCEHDQRVCAPTEMRLRGFEVYVKRFMERLCIYLLGFACCMFCWFSKVEEITFINTTITHTRMLAVYVDEHISCACGCLLKAEDCAPTATYDAATCSCICKNPNIVCPEVST